MSYQKFVLSFSGIGHLSIYILFFTGSALLVFLVRNDKQKKKRSIYDRNEAVIAKQQTIFYVINICFLLLNSYADNFIGLFAAKVEKNKFKKNSDCKSKKEKDKHISVHSVKIDVP